VKTKKSTKTKPTPTPDFYLTFLQQAALQGIGLDKAVIKVDRHAMAEVATAGGHLPLGLTANFSVISHTAERLVIGADFRVNQFHKNPKGAEKSLLDIECSFSALFHLRVECDKAVADRFASSEAKLIFWPYLRHFISDTTYRMSVTPILVPLMTATNVLPDHQK
jgi:hypothetical protein